MLIAEQNQHVAAQFLSAWNAGAADIVDALAHPDLTVECTHFGEPVQGIERFKHILRESHHQEVLFGLPPSGKRLRVQGIMTDRITGGKVLEKRGIVANLSLVMQLQIQN